MAESQSTLYLWKVSEHAQEPLAIQGEYEAFASCHRSLTGGSWHFNAIFKYGQYTTYYIMVPTLEKIHKELKTLRRDIVFIKKHMFDPDTIMTTEEGRRFEQSMKELKKGKTTSLSELKKELGI